MSMKDLRINTISCTNSFKSMLRTYGENGSRKCDILRVSLPEKINYAKFKNSKSTVFIAKELPASQSKRLLQKYVNNYVYGSLGSNMKNMKMKRNAKDIQAKPSCRKTKAFIDSDNPEMGVPKKPPAVNRFYNIPENGAVIRVNRLAARKNNQHPFRSLSAEELNAEFRMKKLNNQSKAHRVEGYMNSESIKNVAFNTSSCEIGNFEKITAKEYRAIGSITPSSMGRSNYLSNNAHKFDNKRGFYIK